MYTTFFSLLWVMMPLVVGFMCKLPMTSRAYHWSHSLITFCLCAILFITGGSLATMDDLGEEVKNVFVQGLCILSVTLFLNIVFLWLAHARKRIQKTEHHLDADDKKGILIFSLKQVVWLVIGFAVGYFVPFWVKASATAVDILLWLILFTIGFQLRSRGVSLWSALFNKGGIEITFFFLLSCWVASWLVSLVLPELTFLQSLAINSGFGWYSLSSGLISNAYGPFWGAVALINDLGREIISFVLIPPLMRFSSAAAIGITGSTSLDFTLPVIKKTGGIHVVPRAISFGFITTLLSPLLMTVFTQLSKLS